MIIPKKRSRRRKSQTSAGRSPSSKFTRQSSSMVQSCSHGPSRKDRSSSESRAGGVAISLDQSGLPEKSSASHQTSPAEMASRSVVESGGSAPRAQRKIGLVT